MEEDKNSIWPWILGFAAYRSYKKRKNYLLDQSNLYIDDTEDDDFDDYYWEDE